MTVETFTPEPRISTFEDLVRMAEMDGPGTKLLVVLVKVQRHQQKTANGDYETMDGEGTLMPLMVRDFALTPDTTLDSIVKEADEVSTDWEFLMTAVMPGQNGQPAPEDETEPHLTRMAQSLTTGESLDRFAFFTRSGEPVRVQAEG